ncbi:MAG: Wzz/FepE/Etk N-terminal domain-containing protein [Prolixibacteraceae bacterium]
MTNKLITQTGPSSGEIDLIDLVQTFRNGRKIFFKSIGIFAAAGLLIALCSPKEYKATSTMVPQKTDVEAKFGGLSGLASMAGINLNMDNTSTISPAVYPQIIASEPFQLELMQTMLNFKAIEHPVSLYDYYTIYKKANPVIRYTVGLPGMILQTIQKTDEGEELPANKNGLIQLTEGQKKVQKIMKNIISIEYNDEDGYVNLTCFMPEPLPAAQLAQRTQELLQRYITVFKIQKANASLEFIQKRFNEVEEQYNQAQDQLAAFRDRNRNMATATAQTELERLRNNYNLIFGVYSELAKQLEQSRIQVKEDTPVFTIIKPVSVPGEKWKPKRTVILVIWLFLGAAAGTAIIFIKKYFASVKAQPSN